MYVVLYFVPNFLYLHFFQIASREDISNRYNTSEGVQRDERKERDRVREAKRERDRMEKQAQEEKQRQKKAEEVQEKMAEQASLMNVEELLTDFNWKASGNAAALEKRLLGELHALEAVSNLFIWKSTNLI